MVGVFAESCESNIFSQTAPTNRDALVNLCMSNGGSDDLISGPHRNMYKRKTQQRAFKACVGFEANLWQSKERLGWSFYGCGSRCC